MLENVPYSNAELQKANVYLTKFTIPVTKKVTKLHSSCPAQARLEFFFHVFQLQLFPTVYKRTYMYSGPADSSVNIS